MNKKIIVIIIIAVFFLLGIVLGRYLYFQSQIDKGQIQRITVKNLDYKFIDPLLAYDNTIESNLPIYNSFKNKLQNLVNKLSPNTSTEKIGLFFKDFKNDFSYGINENSQFHPASLFKVPLMMSYLAALQNDPNLLNKTILYKGGVDANQLETTKPKQYIEPGDTYTISDIINYMIIYSDNNATNLLLSIIDKQSFDAIFNNLGIQLPSSVSEKFINFVTPKQFALFFRILRNSTYLDLDTSEKALEILSKSDYKNGLVAGVPSGITVSHKFGEYASEDSSGNKIYQLHDCGIIYGPHNYLLCIMTMGKDYDNLKNDIVSISKFIYREIVNNYQ